jgi:hypothetical protein
MCESGEEGRGERRDMEGREKRLFPLKSNVVQSNRLSCDNIKSFLVVTCGQFRCK